MVEAGLDPSPYSIRILPSLCVYYATSGCADKNAITEVGDKRERRIGSFQFSSPDAYYHGPGSGVDVGDTKMNKVHPFSWAAHIER